MINTIKRLLFICTLLLLLGFTLGTAVEAGSGDGPGSASDPLASQGYVHQAVNERLGELQQQAADLQQRVGQLSRVVASLEQRVSTNVNNKENVVPKGLYLLDEAVSVYYEPNTNADVLWELQPKDTFEVIELVEDWYHIKLANGSQGWIKAEYVKTK